MYQPRHMSNPCDRRLSDLRNVLVHASRLPKKKSRDFNGRDDSDVISIIYPAPLADPPANLRNSDVSPSSLLFVYGLVALIISPALPRRCPPTMIK